MSKLGLIPVKKGIKLDQYLDETLLVLVESLDGQSYRIMDYSVDVFKGLWILLN